MLKLFALCAVGLSLSGCSVADTSATKAQLATIRQETEAEYQEAKTAGDDKAAERAAKTLEKVKQAEDFLGKATGPDGAFDPGKAAGAAGALLPPPWNLIVMLGAPLLAAGVQELRVRKKEADAVSIINGIEALKATDPGVKTALKTHENVVKAEYTSGAKAMVRKHKLTTT